MSNLTKYIFTNSTGEDQMNYFTGEFSTSLQAMDVVVSKEIENGTYRIVDGELYQVKTDLPPELVECK